MRRGFDHPQGLAPPKEWDGRQNISAAEYQAWLKSEGRPAARPTGHPRGVRKFHEDLGHSTRSLMEANFERFLKFLGYQLWTEKGADPPQGDGALWYRYEGRSWTLPGGCGDYLTDFEVWPGLIEAGRPYEVIEIKGHLDARSKTKLNRMRKLYPDVVIELITPERLDELVGKGKSVIPNWE